MRVGFHVFSCIGCVRWSAAAAVSLASGRGLLPPRPRGGEREREGTNARALAHDAAPRCANFAPRRTEVGVVVIDVVVVRDRDRGRDGDGDGDRDEDRDREGGGRSAAARVGACGRVCELLFAA